MLMKLAGIHPHFKRQAVWHVQLALIAAISLQLLLNQHLSFGPKYLITSLELILMVLLDISRRSKITPSDLKRFLAFCLLALITFANLASFTLVIHALFSNSQLIEGRDLLISAVSIYLTNIIIFGLWYWELDGVGKKGVNYLDGTPTDFLFPQNRFDKNWIPTFFDYLYISITCATAFSSTDTSPLTHRAKLLMGIQGIVTLATVAMLTARAVNILG